MLLSRLVVVRVVGKNEERGKRTVIPNRDYLKYMKHRLRYTLIFAFRSQISHEMFEIMRCVSRLEHLRVQSTDQRQLEQ